MKSFQDKVAAISQKLDVSNREAVQVWADKVVADHGAVNLIFNNAGVAHGSTIEAAAYEDFDVFLSPVMNSPSM